MSKETFKKQTETIEEQTLSELEKLWGIAGELDDAFEESRRRRVILEPYEKWITETAPKEELEIIRRLDELGKKLDKLDYCDWGPKSQLLRAQWYGLRRVLPKIDRDIKFEEVRGYRIVLDVTPGAFRTYYINAKSGVEAIAKAEVVFNVSPPFRNKDIYFISDPFEKDDWTRFKEKVAQGEDDHRKAINGFLIELVENEDYERLPGDFWEKQDLIFSEPSLVDKLRKTFGI